MRGGEDREDGEVGGEVDNESEGEADEDEMFGLEVAALVGEEDTCEEIG